MPRCGCQGKPALYSSGLSLRKSSNSRNGSNSLVSPKPKARRRCTPAPSMVGFDWMIYFTGRMGIMHLVDALQVLAVLPYRHEVGALDIDTAADGCHLQFGRDQAQLLNRPRATDRA